MSDAELPLSPVAPSGSSPSRPVSRPSFLRTTIQKLNADTARRPLDATGVPANPTELPLVGPDSRVKIGHTFWPEPQKTARDPWQHDRCVVADRCYLKGVLVHDLERYRSAYAEELRGQLTAVQEALRDANVAGLAGRFFEEVAHARAREGEARQELEQVRGHYEELLRLNTQLRQREIDALLMRGLDAMQLNVGAMQQTSERIVASCEHATEQFTQLGSLLGGGAAHNPDLGAAVAAEVRQALEKELQPLKAGQQNMQAKLKRVESFNTNLVTELRTMVLAELQPLKAGQQALQARLKRAEHLEAEFLQRRGEVDQKMQLLQEAQAPQRPAAEAGQGGADAMGRLEAWARETSGLLQTNHGKILGNHTKVLNNHTRMCENLGDIQKTLEALRDGFEQVGSAVQQLPDKVSAQMQAIESAEEGEVRRLKQQLLAKDRQLERLRHELEREKAGAVSWLGKVRELEKRGNLKINLKNGDVDMRDIPFVARKPSQEPVAEFANEGEAMEILSDLAELWEMFKVDMSIEGHTRGGENEFWQQLASNRAALVASKLAEMGVDHARLHPEGLPGNLGKNAVAVDVQLDIFPDVD